MGELDIAGENAPLPDKGIPFLLGPSSLTQTRKKAKFKWPAGIGNTNLKSSPCNNQGGVHINRELRSTKHRVIPITIILIHGAKILGRENETDVEIDGIISKALIDSGAMILMMSKDYCYEHGYEIQPLEHLVPIEGSGGASVPY